jgi:hypothetical protein
MTLAVTWHQRKKEGDDKWYRQLKIQLLGPLFYILYLTSREHTHTRKSKEMK